MPSSRITEGHLTPPTDPRYGSSTQFNRGINESFARLQPVHPPVSISNDDIQNAARDPMPPSPVPSPVSKRNGDNTAANAAGPSQPAEGPTPTTPASAPALTKHYKRKRENEGYYASGTHRAAPTPANQQICFVEPAGVSSQPVPSRRFRPGSQRPQPSIVAGGGPPALCDAYQSQPMQRTQCVRPQQSPPLPMTAGELPPLYNDDIGWPDYNEVIRQMEEKQRLQVASLDAAWGATGGATSAPSAFTF